MKGKKAFTLMELLASLALLGLVLLAANSSELNVRIFLNKEIEKFSLLKDATYALDYIIKTARTATTAESISNGILFRIYEPQASGLKLERRVSFQLVNENLNCEDAFSGFSGILVKNVKTFNTEINANLVTIEIVLAKNKQELRLKSYACLQND